MLDNFLEKKSFFEIIHSEARTTKTTKDVSKAKRLYIRRDVCRKVRGKEKKK